MNKSKICVFLILMLMVFALAAPFLNIIPVSASLTKYENYTHPGAQTYSGDAWGIEWVAQTFNATSTHNITRLKLYSRMYETGGYHVIFGIRATSSGSPTGEDLGNVTVVDTDIGTTTAWKQINFSTPITVTFNTTYAIVVRNTEAPVNTKVYWWWCSPSNPYSEGQEYLSVDNGSSWSPQASKDLGFQNWGTDVIDASAPTYSTLIVNSSIPGQGANFSVYVDDDIDLSHYIFGTNNTGSWINETVTAFTSTPQLISIVKTLDSTEGDTVAYEWYMNDTSNFWNNTGFRYVLLAMMPSINGSIAATMLSPSGIRWQQKTFYASGRYWLFYINGTYAGAKNAWFTSSLDGTTWATPTMLSATTGEQTGENIEAILGTDNKVNVFVRGVTLLYRKGTPNSDGTITWLADWQLAWDPGGSNADFYAVLDSNGYPWVSWCIGSLPCDVYVSRSDLDTGIWHTPSGYPVRMALGYNNNMLDALPDGQIYLMYFQANSGVIRGSLWNGSAWSANETVSSSSVIEQYAYAHESWSRSSVVDSNGYMHLVFLSTTYKLIYIERTASGWTSETTLAYSLPIYASPSMNYYPASTKIFCYYINDIHSIFSLSMNTATGVWDTTPTWAINNTNSIPSGYDGGYDGRINGFSQTLNNMIGLVWVQNGTASGTYDIKFALLSPVVEVTINSPTNTTYTSETVSVSFTASDGTIDKQWYNLDSGSNQTYTIPTSITLSDGTYTLNAYANNTIGDEGSASVTFTVAIVPTSEGGQPGSGTVSNVGVLFKVTLNGKAIENCQIRIVTTSYQEYVGTYMTDEQGKATADLPVGTYTYKATYQQKQVNGTFQHVEDETIELELGSGTSETTRTLPALDKTQLTKIGIGIMIVAVAVVAITAITKKRKW